MGSENPQMKIKIEGAAEIIIERECVWPEKKRKRKQEREKKENRVIQEHRRGITGARHKPELWVREVFYGVFMSSMGSPDHRIIRRAALRGAEKKKFFYAWRRRRQLRVASRAASLKQIKESPQQREALNL